MAEKEAGMDEEQAQKDRAGFTTTVENVTTGVKKPFDEGGGMEVGNPYDADPMGESKSGVTYGGGKK